MESLFVNFVEIHRAHQRSPLSVLKNILDVPYTSLLLCNLKTSNEICIKIDNKTPKVENILFAIDYNNSFDQPIKSWVKMFLKLFRMKCKVKEQILFGQHINETK